MPERPITCLVLPAGIGIVPTRINIPNQSGVTNFLSWSIPPENEGTFDSSEFFEWKGGSSGKPAVNFVNSKRLESDEYVNAGPDRRVWAYKIKVSNEWVDPEVNNEPPGGPAPGPGAGGPGGGAGGPGGGAGGPGGGPNNPPGGGGGSNPPDNR